MKKTIENQNEIIMKMQDTVKRLVGHVSTLAKNQQIQGLALKKMDAAMSKDEVIEAFPIINALT